MIADIPENELKAFKDDTRVACQYGAKCYQTNLIHKQKYKHPPSTKKQQQQKLKVNSEIIPITNKDMKRKIDDCHESDESMSEGTGLQSKFKKMNVPSDVVNDHCISPSPSESTDNDDSEIIEHENGNRTIQNDQLCDNSTVESQSNDKNDNKPVENVDTSKASSLKFSNNLNNISKTQIISKIFLFDMPDDFYKFYDFCTTISANDPSSALKIVDLQLVGAYDVLNGIINDIPEDLTERSKYLRHWRYFYDPPEFQTVVKGNDKEGLHYGYWRDECNEKPIFVAKNSANTSCKIIPVASNIFGAVKYHIDERLKLANPFEKSKITRVLKSLITFAKDHGISIVKNSSQMLDRERKVVTKTLHGAGIVVPYNKKTQLGYRNLAATDSELQKIFKKIINAESEEVKLKYMNEIEDIVRKATIAADECDFGTVLELAHDLFASGIESIQKTTQYLFTMSYNLLSRLQFLKIAEEHLKNRKKSCDLSVV